MNTLPWIVIGSFHIELLPANQKIRTAEIELLVRMIYCYL